MVYSSVSIAINLNASLTFLGSLLTLILVLIRHKQQKKKITISLLLIIIMLFSKILLSVGLIVLLTSTASNQYTFVCRLKGYIAIVTNASLYCSFCLQLFYGLCRVRFSKNRTLSHSRRFPCVRLRSNCAAIAAVLGTHFDAQLRSQSVY